MSKIIGLTGRRHVGKSASANWLVEAGFTKAHAFDGGKIATAAYFEHLGASKEEAQRMVYGDLRDVPSPLLPGNQTPRYFMELFGKFMGTTLGPEWTLGMELAIARRRRSRGVVVESIVYEADCLRAAGGLIARIVRPGTAGPAGMMTDDFEATIVADVTIVNDGSLADLRNKVMALAS